MTLEKTDAHLRDWIHREELAETILPLTGALYRKYGVVTTVCGVSLVHKNPVEIIKAHRYMRKYNGEILPLETTLEVLRAMDSMPRLAPARVDIGKLVEKAKHKAQGKAIGEFVKAELAELETAKPKLRDEPQDVVLYGFGRIGRLLARILVDKVGGGDKFRLRAIVVRKQTDDDLEKRASLLRRDSIHGPFEGSIEIDKEGKALVVNGNYIKLIDADQPENVDYTSYGFKDVIILDNTGKWRDREGLGRHLKAKGVSKVILTAPGKGDIPNIVFGVNHATVNPEERILSAASCTTNAIVPVLKAMNDQFGIDNGHIETVHSYTNDQNLTDNFHKKERRGRSAPLNMVITETGAASAVAKALPELKGRITGNAIRVPTPNVSLAILVLNLKREVSVDEINDYLRKMSVDSPLQNQIDYTQSPDVASSDMVGNRHASIIDAKATIVSGSRATIYAWYDNEYGYSCQVVRLLQQVAGVLPPAFPKG
ncbi:MAG: glyceraldehyde-3-phosphate dehydrogenase [Polyangiales bacterium]